MEDNSQNHLVTLGSMLVKRRVGKPVLEDRPRSEATTSTSSTSSTTLATTQESQQPQGRTPILKPSSNSTVPVAWIAVPAMDTSQFSFYHL